MDENKKRNRLARKVKSTVCLLGGWAVACLVCGSLLNVRDARSMCGMQDQCAGCKINATIACGMLRLLCGMLLLLMEC